VPKIFKPAVGHNPDLAQSTGLQYGHQLCCVKVVYVRDSNSNSVAD
jgi:hypothetical protein